MYIIFDLEATCWENAPFHMREEMETIEIGAVEVDDKFNATGRTFQTFIKPFLNPLLSDFCKQLTSITQDQVNSAKDFYPAFDEFLIWSGFKLVGAGGANHRPKPRFISWGDFDFHQLTKDCTRSNCQMFDKRFHLNGKHLYKDFTGRIGHGLGTELKKQKIPFEGIAHRGIDDAKMITKLLWKVSKPLP